MILGLLSTPLPLNLSSIGLSSVAFPAQRSSCDHHTKTSSDYRHLGSVFVSNSAGWPVKFYVCIMARIGPRHTPVHIPECTEFLLYTFRVSWCAKKYAPVSYTHGPPRERGTAAWWCQGLVGVSQCGPGGLSGVRLLHPPPMQFLVRRVARVPK